MTDAPTEYVPRILRDDGMIEASEVAHYTHLDLKKYVRVEAVNDLRADLAACQEERDLAIAHDRQPYPTAWAYEQVCRVKDELEAKLAACEQERDELKSVVLSVYRSQMGVPAVQALDDLRKVGMKYDRP